MITVNRMLEAIALVESSLDDPDKVPFMATRIREMVPHLAIKLDTSLPDRELLEALLVKARAWVEEAVDPELSWQRKVERLTGERPPSIAELAAEMEAVLESEEETRSVAAYLRLASRLTQLPMPTHLDDAALVRYEAARLREAAAQAQQARELRRFGAAPPKGVSLPYSVVNLPTPPRDEADFTGVPHVNDAVADSSGTVDAEAIVRDPKTWN